MKDDTFSWMGLNLQINELNFLATLNGLILSFKSFLLSPMIIQDNPSHMDRATLLIHC